MGIDTVTAQYIKQYINGHILTIGRQALFGDNKDYANLLSISVEEFEKIRAKSNGLAEGLLEHLGAIKVDSLDYSDYEGATLIHDLNTRIYDKYSSKFDVVLDSGTLEHIFNFPMALFNCMDMVAHNGLLIICSPANNQLGHGFYQLSPELFFRTLANVNGYRLIDLSLRIGDLLVPIMDDFGTRHEIETNQSTYVYVVAKRVARLPMFVGYPQQSDYIVQWGKK